MNKEYSRITPACAGKSRKHWRSKTIDRDHPRLRGEKFFRRNPRSFGQGSPPLARGKGQKGLVMYSKVGITPACAGKSSLRLTVRDASEDHPRLRGEKICGLPY